MCAEDITVINHASVWRVMLKQQLQKLEVLCSKAKTSERPFEARFFKNNKAERSQGMMVTQRFSEEGSVHSGVFVLGQEMGGNSLMLFSCFGFPSGCCSALLLGCESPLI